MSRLFVGNIPHGSSETDLHQWFERYGFPLESAEIIRDFASGLSRGFAFVTLRGEPRAQDTIAALNGQRLGGRVITVNEALPRPSAAGNPARRGDGAWK